MIGAELHWYFDSTPSELTKQSFNINIFDCQTYLNGAEGEIMSAAKLTIRARQGGDAFEVEIAYDQFLAEYYK